MLALFNYIAQNTNWGGGYFVKQSPAERTVVHVKVRLPCNLNLHSQQVRELVTSNFKERSLGRIRRWFPALVG